MGETMRTPEEWARYCERNITSGYVPGRKKSLTYSSGVMLEKSISALLQWKSGDTIVDVGCGNGRLAFGLLPRNVTYHGMDVVLGSIQFCRKAFVDYPNFHFYHLNIKNSWYAPKNSIAPDKVTYPLQDGVADFVVASSLFSHTGEIRVARRNLAEMRRIVKKPGGVIYSTWILGDNYDPTDRRTFYTIEQVEELLEGDTYEIIPAWQHEAPETRSQTVIIIRSANG